jgi:membrane-bound metal-dependent hydrolase YbcI (DUF457 family)
MMGRSHALCGLTAGAAASATLGDLAPWTVRILLVPVMGGAALLPDIDHPSSRVARSLGLVTKGIALAVAAGSLAVYHATRTDADHAARKSGHRTLTHTVPGALVFGVMTLIAVMVHPAAGAGVMALLIGLLAQGFRSIGTGFSLAGALLSWVTLTHDPGWWWVWPLAVTLGSLVHVAGDWVTNSGVPLWWPLLRDGRRWSLVHAPVTFSTGTPTEAELVTPFLVAGFAVAAGFATGVVPLLFHAWMVS